MVDDCFLNELEIMSKKILNELGTGFNEVVYQNALEVELRLIGVYYEKEVIIPIKYKKFSIGHGRADIIIKNNDKNLNDYNCIIPDLIIELKAINTLNGREIHQLGNYLRSTKIKNGILINFNQKTGNVEFIRVKND